AFSAIRAGYSPICGDMFADVDLQKFAAVLDVPDYPQRLTEAAQHVTSDVPWIYTGAMENWPGEVARVSARHPLWGNSAEVLRRSRDPWEVATVLARNGIAPLELQASANPPARDGTWMMKPLKSSAGRAVSVWNPDTLQLIESHCFQRRIEGPAISGVF